MNIHFFRQLLDCFSNLTTFCRVRYALVCLELALQLLPSISKDNAMETWFLHIGKIRFSLYISKFPIINFWLSIFNSNLQITIKVKVLRVCWCSSPVCFAFHEIIWQGSLCILLQLFRQMMIFSAEQLLSITGHWKPYRVTNMKPFLH